MTFSLTPPPFIVILVDILSVCLSIHLFCASVCLCRTLTWCWSTTWTSHWPTTIACVCHTLHCSMSTAHTGAMTVSSPSSDPCVSHIVGWWLFLANRTSVTVELLSCLSSVCVFIHYHYGCIVAKRCNVVPRLLLITNRKSPIGFQIKWKSLTVVGYPSNSCASCYCWLKVHSECNWTELTLGLVFDKLTNGWAGRAHWSLVDAYMYIDRRH